MAYIQIHWKMEKDPMGIELMTINFIERHFNQLSYWVRYYLISYHTVYIQIHTDTLENGKES